MEIFSFIKNKYDVFQNPGGLFVDIGSVIFTMFIIIKGTGKGILAGCFMHEFKRC